MCLIKLPQLEGNKLEVNRIIVIPGKGESAVRLGTDIAREVAKRARPHWFSKTNNWQHNIQENLRQRGQIKTWPALKLEIKEGGIEISLTHWLHRNKTPDPQLAVGFFTRAIVAATGGIIIPKEIEPATSEETQEIINRLIRESSDIQRISLPTSFSFSFSFSAFN